MQNESIMGVSWLNSIAFLDAVWQKKCSEKETAMKNRRRLWIVLATVCTLLVCAGLCVGLILHRENELNDIQNEALEELRNNRGEYDEKSIVLYDTNRGEAQALAEKFDAELRISFDGKFATLTLPGDVTVEDIYSARGKYARFVRKAYDARRET